MAELQRLTMWGWFVRAFAGGFGAMFGVLTALVVACVFGYAMVAAGAVASSSIGGVTISPGVTAIGNPVTDNGNAVMAIGTATNPWATATPQCLAPPTPVQSFPVHEARAHQPQDHPYYTSRGPADFLPTPVAPSTTNDPAIESAPADLPPAIDADE